MNQNLHSLALELSHRKMAIIGSSGYLSQLIVSRIKQLSLENCEIHGIDNRQISSIISNETLGKSLVTTSATTSFKYYHHFGKFTPGYFKNFFLHHPCDTVLILGKFPYFCFKENDEINERLDRKSWPIAEFLNLCSDYKVKTIIFLSSYQVYLPFLQKDDSDHFLIKEDHPFGSKQSSYLSYVTQSDSEVLEHLKMNKDQKIYILRPSNIIGPETKNLISTYIKLPFLPIPLDYTPKLQFISAYDVAKVILYFLTSSAIESGAYNLTGENGTTYSLKELAKILRKKSVPFSVSMFEQFYNLICPILPTSLKFSSFNELYFEGIFKKSILLNCDKIRNIIPSDLITYSLRDSIDLMQTHL